MRDERLFFDDIILFLKSKIAVFQKNLGRW